MWMAGGRLGPGWSRRLVVLLAVGVVVGAAVSTAALRDGSEEHVQATAPRVEASEFWASAISVPTSAPPASTTTVTSPPPTAVESAAPTTTPTTTASPAPAPAESAPAVWSGPEDCLGLYDVDVTSATARQLLAKRVESPTWSPDGRRIAYGSTAFDSTGSRSSTWMMDADGTNQRVVEGAPGVQWGPDSRSLWGSRRVEDSDGQVHYDIVRFDVDTGAVTAMRPDGWPEWKSIGGVVLSPMADRVAFASSDVGLYVVQADGSGLVELAGDDVRRFGQPIWSPDGRYLAASLQHPESSIVIYAADGSSSRTIAVTDSGVMSIGGWSPDGQLVTFTRQPAASGATVEVARPDGTGHRVLAAGGGSAFSPDGSWIAFGVSIEGVDESGARTVRPQVHLIRPDGADQHVVIDGSGFEMWSPDSRRLLSRCGGSDFPGRERFRPSA